MSIITIRKANLRTPSYYKLTNVFNPPHITVNDVLTYYNIYHEFYIEDDIYYDTHDNIYDNADEDNCDMNIDSDSNKSNISNISMQISSDGDINIEQEKLEKIYYQINSVVNGFTLNHGDIIEFPNGQMYFYHNPCIRIN